MDLIVIIIPHNIPSLILINLFWIIEVFFIIYLFIYFFVQNELKPWFSFLYGIIMLLGIALLSGIAHKALFIQLRCHHC